MKFFFLNLAMHLQSLILSPEESNQLLFLLLQTSASVWLERKISLDSTLCLKQQHLLPLPHILFFFVVLQPFIYSTRKLEIIICINLPVLPVAGWLHSTYGKMMMMALPGCLIISLPSILSFISISTCKRCSHSNTHLWLACGCCGAHLCMRLTCEGRNPNLHRF